MLFTHICRKVFLQKMDQIFSRGNLYKDSFTICIEGNIGSGKTTFLKNFEKFDNATILAEPVKLWQNVGGINLLEKMYKEPENYSFLFQSYAQLTRLQLHTMKVPTFYKIMERSIFSTKCFLENMKRVNMLPKTEAIVLEKWYDWCLENTNIKIDLIIYLRTTPEIVYERMQARARKEEESVSLEYLRQIHEIHEDWLYKRTLFSLPAQVAIIDGNKSLEEMVPQFEKFKNQILSKNDCKTSDLRIIVNNSV